MAGTSVGSVQASNADVILLDSATMTYGYDGAGNLTAETAVYNGKTYVKTYTYNGSNVLTNRSGWVAQ